MKQLRTKVLLSAFVLIFALVATIGSTFAWFTISTSVQVDTMALNVSTENSLLIKVRETGETFATASLLDASEYKTFLPYSDIIAAYPDLTTWRLSPVTVINSTYTGIDATGFRVLNTPNTDYTRALTAASAPVINDADGYVIQLQFWVLSQGDAANTHLIVEDLLIDNNGTVTSDGVENAVRLAVSVDDNVQTAGQPYVFGLDNNYDFTYVDNLPGYFADVPNYYDGSNVLQGFNKLADLTKGYDGLGTGVNVEGLLHADANNGKYKIAADPITNASVTAAADATRLFTLVQDRPTLVTVTIFVEGWAAGATNNIIAANFDISWKFSIHVVA